MAEPFNYVVRVGYRDTDQMGFVHHSVYFVWMESARTELLRSLGDSYKAWEDAGYLIPLTGARCDFRKAARYDDLIAVETTVAEVSRLRLRFDYSIRRGVGGELLAVGSTDHIFMDPSGRPRRLDADRLAKLTACMPGPPPPQSGEPGTV